MKALLAFLLLTTAVMAETKQDLIDNLDARFSEVGIPYVVQDTLPDFNVKWYKVSVLDINADSMARGKAISFYVIDEDLAEEAAYLNKTIALATEDIFTPFIVAYLDTVTTTYTYIFKDIGYTNLETQTAEVAVWMDSSGRAVPKTLWMRKVGSNMIHREMTE